MLVYYSFTNFATGSFIGGHSKHQALIEKVLDGFGRNEQAGVVITSNKGFEGWADIIGDSVLTTALLDRLTHRCQVLSFTGDGWRVAHREVIFEDS